MKVLFINAESGYGGGPAIIVDGIYHAVCERGGEGLVAYGRQADPNSDVKKYYIKNGAALYAHVALSRLFDLHGFGSKAATKKLLQVVDEFQPDLVNLHNIHGYYVHCGELFRYFAEKHIPVVWTFHDCWPFTGHCAYFDRVNCDKWKSGCYHCPQTGTYPASVLDNSAGNYARKKKLFTLPEKMTIVTPSDWLKNLVGESFLSKYPCKTIHNGIDLSLYRPIPSDWKKEHIPQGNKMLLGCAAIWAPRKGLDDLLKIAEALGEGYTLVLVGLNEQQIAALPQGVIGIRRTESREELIKLYAAADVFVNASIEDNFPTVILEALACGTPVVTYDTGGSRESLNEKCGAYVEQKNIPAFCEAVKTVLTFENASEECLKRISEFEEKKKYGQYADLFAEMIGGK